MITVPPEAPVRRPSQRGRARSLLPAALLAFGLAGSGAAGTLDASKAGAVGDGTTLNTQSLQAAIDRCAASGGGVVVLPAGTYLTGTLELKSSVTLRLEAGATLRGSTSPSDYRNLDPFIDGSGNPLGYSLLVAVGASNVGLEGPGTVDGQGPQLKANEHPYTIRPFLVRWVRCSNVTVRNVRLENPGAWTLNFAQTQHALVENVTIRSRGLGIQNNDGVNIDSSEDIHVNHCDVVSGDDALVIKSTSRSLPCRRITASDCELSSNTNAIKLGTESIGGFDDITISRCRITHTRMSGIALYEVDGGDLRNVVIRDVTMDGVALPISIRLGARLKTFRAGEAPRPSPGHLSDVLIQNVTARNVGTVGILMNGVPGHPIESVVAKNVRIEVPGGGTAEDARVVLPEKEAAYPEYDMFGKTIPAYGIYLRHVKGVVFSDVMVFPVKTDGRPAAVSIDAEGVGF